LLEWLKGSPFAEVPTAESIGVPFRHCLWKIKRLTFLGEGADIATFYVAVVNAWVNYVKLGYFFVMSGVMENFFFVMENGISRF
jgi:hypothetical protein